MIQEIITYLIIGSAVTIAVMKMINKFRKKKIRKTTNIKTQQNPTNHNCADCSAECILRDTIQVKNQENLCTKVNSESN